MEALYDGINNFCNVAGNSSSTGCRITFTIFVAVLHDWLQLSSDEIVYFLFFFSCFQLMKSCSGQKLFLIFERVTLKVLLRTLKFSILLHFMFLIVGPRTTGPFYNTS